MTSVATMPGAFSVSRWGRKKSPGSYSSTLYSSACREDEGRQEGQGNATAGAGRALCNPRSGPHAWRCNIHTQHPAISCVREATKSVLTCMLWVGRPSPPAASLTARSTFDCQLAPSCTCAGSSCQHRRTLRSTTVAAPWPWGAWAATLRSASACSADSGRAMRPRPCSSGAGAGGRAA